MTQHDDSLTTNRRTWDRWTAINHASDFYDVEAFLEGPVPGRARLDRLDAQLLGDVEDRSLLHLQCHFGMDTLTQARRGACVVGVDFSAEAIRRATELAQRVDLRERAEFLEHDVLSLDLGRQFDFVYTSWGVLNWLSDLEAWAGVVSRHLRPGGRFVLIEGHPAALQLEPHLGPPVPADGGQLRTDQVAGDTPAGTPSVLYRAAYPYFPGPPIRFESNEVYSDPDASIDSQTIEWQHSLSEVIGSLLAAGLVLEAFDEYPFCAWRLFSDLQQTKDGVWVLPKGHVSMPLSFSVVARQQA